MLFLLLYLDNGCYALDASLVVEVLPLVRIEKPLRSPQGVVGTINYRRALVPVIDLSELALGRPAAPRLSTRIILVRCSEEDGQPRLLGLIAEKAIETMRCQSADFVPSGITNADASYLGAITMGPRGLVQRIELNKLLPAAVPGMALKQSA